jgi:zinc protease
VASAGVKATATDSSVVEFMKEINKFRTSGVTDAELTFMKSSIGQRDALRYETGNQKAGFIGRILTYGLPANFVETQNKILASLSKKEADALAKKWINPDKMNILLVGDKVKILPSLQKLGYDIVELDIDGNRK